MMVLAVTLHNIPEGMAVGIVYAGFLSGSADMTSGGALALALGIVIQNFPEGAIISMPLHAEGTSKRKAFADGVLSGAVEPVGAALTILFAGLFHRKFVEIGLVEVSLLVLVAAGDIEGGLIIAAGHRDRSGTAEGPAA